MKIVAALILFLIAGVAGAAPVAQVAETKGAVTVVRGDGKQRLLATGSTLDVGETVVTEENSVAVLAFTDGSKVALRPNTRFVIASYSFSSQAPKADRGFFDLIAGGLRTVTGAIGKRGDRDAYRVTAGTATIGIRGTEYTARLCGGDCTDTAAPAKTRPAARIASLQGSVTATDGAGRTRHVAAGDALAPGDRIDTTSGAWAGITFSDDTRVVVRQASSFQITNFHYAAERPRDDGFAVRLIKGAFRTLTGVLAKRSADRMKFVAGTATIGIRGTAFDAWCVRSGSVGGSVTPAEATSCDQGLLATISEGRIAMTNVAGSSEAGVGEIVYADAPGARPSQLPPTTTLPAADGAPSPAGLPAFDTLPPSPAAQGDGVYLLVHDGEVGITQSGQTIAVRKGESAFASIDGTAPRTLDAPPGFLDRDPSLRKVDFDAVSCNLP